MKYFPKKLTMTWIRNSYKEGSLSPEELAGEIVRRAEKYRDYCRAGSETDDGLH